MSRYDDPRWYEEQDATPPPSDRSPFADQQHTWSMNSNSHDSQQDLLFPPLPEQRRESRLSHILRQAVILIALVVVAFVAGWFSHQFFGNSFTQSNASRSYEQMIQQAWIDIDQNYVDRKAVNYKTMAYNAIQSMVDTLHDTGHSRFLTPDQIKQQNQSLSGSVSGIGITLLQDTATNQFIITSIIPGSPAERAGLKADDIILAVNGTSVAGMSIDQVPNLVDGPAGTKVSMTVKRPSTQQTLTFTMTREQITIPSVLMHYISESHIVDIQITQFSDGVANQLHDALKQAKKMGATKIILDLRDNPGGYVNEAIDTASQFMKSGNVYLQQDSSGQRTPIAVTGNAFDTTDAIVVLVNKNTASAAEIVSGSLQDNKRAIIMGETTFGTGTVLQQFDLPDGSALLLGVQEWLTPDGKFIRNQGITPNVIVKLDPKTPPLTPDVANTQHLTEQQILSRGDTQLAAAIHYLNTH